MLRFQFLMDSDLEPKLPPKKAGVGFARILIHAGIGSTIGSGISTNMKCWCDELPSSFQTV